MNHNELTDRVLAHVHAANYRPVKPRVIAKQLDLTDEQHDDLKRVIKRLVKKGGLRWGPKHLVLPGEPPAAAPPLAGETVAGQPRLSSKKNVLGIFRRAAAGFGFVRPQGTSAADGRSKDIYVPRNQTLDAADGDVVEVRLVSGGRRGGDLRPRGELVQVVERDTHQFVGLYFERGGEGRVQVDGGVFAQPVRVGDAGAKDAREGDKVVIELVRFPTHFDEGEGVITQVLGARGAPGVDTLSIIKEYSLPEEFPPAAMEVARQQADAFTEEIGPERLDLTGETTITIDPVDARDFDDAISLTRLEGGHWRLGVHIADVSHFVPVGSALDIEAFDRATSVYLPDRVLPMLPEIISNHLASLQPDRVRYARTVFIEFLPTGARVAADVHASAIKSRRRFTYEEVDEYLADPEAWRERLAPDVHRLLGEMHELAMILRQRRLERGAIELNLPEVKIDLDDDGRVAGAHVVENTVSHQIIEEFMLAANEAVADKLRDHELLFLRRIHEPPDLRKLESLTTFVRELGVDCDSLVSRFEIKRVLADAAERPEMHAINFAVLRSMQKAVYSPHDEGHYALASDCYCHFTSPIRRYPDLTVHRLFAQLDAGKKPANNFDVLASWGDHCSEREQRAERAERDLIKVKLLGYLSGKLGMKLDAIVTGVEDYGLFVQGIELPADGFVAVQTLADDYYHYDSATHSLSGRKEGNWYRLGDRLRVEVVHVDVERRELDFRVVGRKPRAEGDRAPRRRPSSRPARKEESQARRGKSKGKKASRDDRGGKKKKRRR